MSRNLLHSFRLAYWSYRSVDSGFSTTFDLRLEFHYRFYHFRRSTLDWFIWKVVLSLTGLPIYSENHLSWTVRLQIAWDRRFVSNGNRVAMDGFGTTMARIILRKLNVFRRMSTWKINFVEREPERETENGHCTRLERRTSTLGVFVGELWAD